METDSFFYQLFKQLPQTLFELLGQPGERAQLYFFESVEIKKSFRIDGLLRPKQATLPVYFVEVQYQPAPRFYANLFAKVFMYLHENPSARDWFAVAIFASRQVEPKHLDPYEDLLRSKRVARIYLDEFEAPANPPFGLGLLQLVSAPESHVKSLVNRFVDRTKQEIADSELEKKVIELLEELLLRRFTQLDRAEIRTMFQLHDIRKSKVWHEAHQTGIVKGLEKGLEEGLEKGREEGQALERQKTVRKCLAKRMTVKEIAEFLEIPINEARRLVKSASK